MSEPRLLAALARRNAGRPPVWFMRQAGRYHRHYQALRARHEFIDLCRQPALAAEVTLGPIEEFGFDAAILFSDLLFPLEAMGMGLRYAPGPQARLAPARALPIWRGSSAVPAGPQHMNFQARGASRLRARLPAEQRPDRLRRRSVHAIRLRGGRLARGLCAQESARPRDGLYQGFNERLCELLAGNMALQARAGADCVAVFDTAAGTLIPAQFARHAAPPTGARRGAVSCACPHTPVIYYSRDTGPEHWEALGALDLQCLGVDWRHDLADTLMRADFALVRAGQYRSEWLLLPPAEMEPLVRSVFARVAALPAAVRAAWVCGLGHGVLPQTPEGNVHRLLQIQREMFS